MVRERTSVPIDVISPEEVGGVYALVSYSPPLGSQSVYLAQLEMVNQSYFGVVRELDSLIFRQIARKGYTIWWHDAVNGFKHVLSLSPLGAKDVGFAAAVATQPECFLADVIVQFQDILAGIVKQCASPKVNPESN